MEVVLHPPRLSSRQTARPGIDLEKLTDLRYWDIHSLAGVEILVDVIVGSRTLAHSQVVGMVSAHRLWGRRDMVFV